ncbi:unnamed protein product [Tilletia controversa]|nr:unnamed protein product [Tilletia controversa]
MASAIATGSSSEDAAALRSPEDLAIQLNACELLLAMWGADDGVELDEGTQTGITDLAKYLALPVNELGSPHSVELKNALPNAIVFSLPVNASDSMGRGEGSKARTLQVEVSLSLRKTPRTNLRPRIQVQRPTWLTRAQYDTLISQAGLSAPQEEDSEGASSEDDEEDPASFVLSTVERISEAVIDLESEIATSSSNSKSTEGRSSQSKSRDVVRAWYHFPSLSSKDKRADLVSYAQHHDPPLTGFVLAGKPGVAVIEAPLPDRSSDKFTPSDITAATAAIDRYWSKIRSSSWADIPAGHKKVSLRLTEDSAGVSRVFTDMQDVTDSILFGLGFDTASSITLLSVAAIAQRDGPEMNSNHGNGRVVLLAFLFTAGMTAVDSCDSVIMMFAYSRLGREDALRSEARTTEKVKADVRVETIPASNVEDEPSQEIESKNVRPADVDEEARESLPGPAEPKIYQGAAPMISFYLTLLSVLLAFSICIIEVFSIVAEQCKSCAAAASVEPPSERSLRGRWWAFWSAASDQLGYIGAGIVGVFVLITLSWWIGRRLYAWRVRKSNGAGQDEDTRFTLKARLKRTLTLCSTGVRLRQSKPRRGLTLLGGSVALIGAEILANAAMWTITAVVFITSHRRSDLALAVLAWTTGLRHGLDADHISAIDNSIRRFLALERQDALSAQLQQLPVVELQNGDSARPTKTSWRQAFWRGFNSPILTGLFFSLGHSTIVIIATVVIAITTSALSGLEAFGDGPGGYVGTIVSATFLGLVGILNSVLLWKAWRARRKLGHT